LTFFPLSVDIEREGNSRLRLPLSRVTNPRWDWNCATLTRNRPYWRFGNHFVALSIPVGHGALSSSHRKRVGGFDPTLTAIGQHGSIPSRAAVWCGEGGIHRKLSSRVHAGGFCGLWGVSFDDTGACLCVCAFGFDVFRH